jgi:hypothetical protein
LASFAQLVPVRLGRVKQDRAIAIKRLLQVNVERIITEIKLFAGSKTFKKYN